MLFLRIHCQVQGQGEKWHFLSSHREWLQLSALASSYKTLTAPSGVISLAVVSFPPLFLSLSTQHQRWDGTNISILQKICPGRNLSQVGSDLRLLPFLGRALKNSCLYFCFPAHLKLTQQYQIPFAIFLFWRISGTHKQRQKSRTSTRGPNVHHSALIMINILPFFIHLSPSTIFSQQYFKPNPRHSLQILQNAPF